MARAATTPTEPADAVEADAPPPRKVLFSAMKNEAPFILEWVAYHLEIGFDRIIIFSNDSDDGTTELLDALDQTGIVEHHRHTPPEGISPQGNAALTANAMALFSDGDWVIWLDADEFLNIHAGTGHVDDLIAVIGDRKGMLIHWRVFGDSGHKEFPGRFVSRDFGRAAFIEWIYNRENKTLFRFGSGIVGFGIRGINRPRVDHTAGLTSDDFLNGNGVPLTASEDNERWLAGDDRANTRRILPADVGAKLAQINHYCVRTPEYFALKRARGRGWIAGHIGETNNRHIPKFYEHMNRNGRVDETILRHETAVTARIAALKAIPAISRAQALADKLTKAALARVQQDMAAAQAAPEVRRFALTLPPAEAQTVIAHYKTADTVLEYGSGGSSFAALENGVKSLMTVESDPDWANSIDRSLRHYFPQADYQVHYVDIGPVGAWGRPTDNSGFTRYHMYALSPWQQPDMRHPDVVLIDGRFRVACFWATVMHISRPVTVLFDDYTVRPEYHWIEKVVPRVDTVGRMARFALEPGTDYQAHLPDVIGSFTDVR